MYDIVSLRNVGLGSAAFMLAIFAGCGSTVNSGNQGGAGGSDVSSSSSSSSSSGVAGMGGSGGSGGSLPTCTSPVLAVDKVFIGDTDPDGTPNPTNGWKQYGFDLDNRISTKNSTDLCKPAQGGSAAAAYPDGINGIDNAYGKNILPIFLGLASDLGVQHDQAIAAGDYTYMFSLANAGQGNCTNLSAFFLGAGLGKAPQFDGTDVWPIDRLSLLDPTMPKSAKCSFADTMVTMGVVQTGTATELTVVLMAGSSKMVVPIHVVRTSFVLAPDGMSATSGVIGGVMRTEDLVQEVAKFAASFDTSFCDPSSPTLISILNQMRQASDILQDGTQDPTKECDGISIGIGFTMKSTLLGPVAPLAPPPPDPCVP